MRPPWEFLLGARGPETLCVRGIPIFSLKARFLQDLQPYS
jgi:hypothetical protein